MSIETIKKFLAEWGKSRQKGDAIYGMHAGCEREVTLTTVVLQGAVDRVTDLETENARLREALLGLEYACEQLAATRPHDVYLAMIDGGQSDALLSLDARRTAARAALSTAPSRGTP